MLRKNKTEFSSKEAISMENQPNKVKKLKLDIENSAEKKNTINIDSSDAVSAIKIEILPREILCIIFSNLDKKSVRNATASCKLWFELIRGDNQLSGYICLEKFGVEPLFRKISIGEWNWARWPVLKTLKFGGLSAANVQTQWHFNCRPTVQTTSSKEMASYLSNFFCFKGCPTLEKVVISVSCNLTGIFPTFPDLPLGIIEELTFDPKIDIESVGIKHVSKLKLSVDLMEWFSKRIPGNDDSGIPEHSNNTAYILKLLGETRHNLKDISLVSRNVGMTHLDVSRHLKNSFGQMFKVLEDRLQSIYLIAGHLSCIDPLVSDSTPITEIWIETTSMIEIRHSYRPPIYPDEKLTGLFQRFKKLRKCRIDLELSEEDEDPNCDTWPEFVKREFQDNADFKFRFVYSKQIVGTVKDEKFQVLRLPRHSHRYKRAIRFEITRQ